jgi:hypothetical protein
MAFEDANYLIDACRRDYLLNANGVQLCDVVYDGVAACGSSKAQKQKEDRVALNGR